MPKIFVIIVNYKSEDVIGDAISSIEEENLNINILVLDNGSSPGSLNNLYRLKTDNIEIISSKNNLGFAGGVNFSFRYIMKDHNDIDYVFLLNPDALSTKNLIFNLYNMMLGDKSIAALSPKILDMNNNDWYSGAVIDWKQCCVINNPVARIDNNKVDLFNGCAVLLDARKFEKSGGFNEDTFLYSDEAFLSMKFLELGYKVAYFPDQIIHHKVSHSVGNGGALKHYYITRNHLYFFTEYRKRENSYLAAYRRPLKNTLWHLKHLNFACFLLGIKAIIHFHLGRKGKL